MVPSREPPSSTCWTWARPWPMASMFSVRVSPQRIGRPRWRASHGSSASSGLAPIFAPNPPPTSGATTRTWFGFEPEHAGERVAHAVGVLGAPPVVEATVCGPRGRRGSSLERAGRHPLVLDAHPDDHVAPVEQTVVGAEGEVGRDVGAGLREEQHLADLGRVDPDDRRERFEVGPDQLHRVDRLRERLGDHGRDRLADEPHAVDREHRAGHLRRAPSSRRPARGRCRRR